MSRITGFQSNIEVVEHDDKIGDVIDIHGERQNKVVLIDGDSLPYICSYQPKTDEFGNPTVYYTKENGGYEIAEGILTEKLLGIYNSVEKYFSISNIYICVKGKNNPRKKWLIDYKAHRPETSDIVKHLFDFMINNHAAFVAPIGEADDVIYSISKTINFKGIICGIDKDLLAVPGIHYNYVKNVWKSISYEQSRYNFWSQVLKGDSSDFRGLSPGIGEKYVEKHLNINFTEEEYKEYVYKGFLKAWKGNEELAKKNMELSHNLVKLWDIKELENLEMSKILLYLHCLCSI